AGASAPLIFVLTSIAWREAWKYQSRAYRYCLLDMGHAWQSLALAARAIGCESFALGHFPDDRVAETCVLNEDEWPMLVIGIHGGIHGGVHGGVRGVGRGGLHGASIPAGNSAGTAAPVETILHGGRPNRLSERQEKYTLIEQIHAATKLGVEAAIPVPGQPETSGRGETGLPAAVSTSPSTNLSIGRGFGDVVRGRRSALDFRGGSESISFAHLAAILSTTRERFSADFATARFVQLYVYVHRVEGLAPGVYRYGPERAELEKIKEGDQRLAAAALSLGQDLAGNACLAVSMIGDFENAARRYGDRGYRYVHFEAGAIGQRMYLAAEALGLRATGIGAFFDDQVHQYLGLPPEVGQVVYHFAIGYPVRDTRLEA
ncbi:MAG TPA: SagB family peptide dehydrogenase, partial [Candidatus Acidoferrales bacterium]|nr:SagB family peptide dehydrogenase [Candidatus Acidoferrales bacterium]